MSPSWFLLLFAVPESVIWAPVSVMLCAIGALSTTPLQHALSHWKGNSQILVQHSNSVRLLPSLSGRKIESFFRAQWACPPLKAWHSRPVQNHELQHSYEVCSHLHTGVNLRCYTQNRYFLLLSLFTLLDWSSFHIFLLASERRFQRIRECSIWILYAKVINEQSLILKAFLPHGYITDFGDVVTVKMALKDGT